MYVYQRLILTVFAGMGLAAFFAAVGSAQPQFDKRIEKAAADQVAKRLGTLRDTFEYNENPELISEDMIRNRKKYLVSGEVWEEAKDRTPTYSIKASSRSVQRYRSYRGSNVRVIYRGTILEN